MRVSIWDMDFFYKKSVYPNPTVMKISSYHKQLGDLVNFIEEPSHVKMPFDLFYIVKEKKATPRPSSKITENNKVRLLGKYFKHEGNYFEIDNVIAAVRPDYMLYPEKEERDPYYNANFVQFYNKGVKLELKQPFENTKKYHKKTVVIDKDFWEHSDENIESCLVELANYKNIAFLAPIKLKKIINSPKIMELFLKLKFSPGTIFKFQNNIGSDIDDARLMFKFIEDLKERNNNVRFGSIPIKCVSSDHWESRENAISDLERCLKIMDESKKRKIRILLVSPPRRDFETPYWYYFEIMEAWSESFYDRSYIEMMLHSAMVRYKLPWYAIINDSLKWALPNTTYLLKIMTKRKRWIMDYGIREWGDNFIDHTLIKWEEIKKFSGGDIIE